MEGVWCSVGATGDLRVPQTYVPCDNVQDFARRSHVSQRQSHISLENRETSAEHNTMVVRLSFALRNGMNNSQGKIYFNHFHQRCQLTTAIVICIHKGRGRQWRIQEFLNLGTRSRRGMIFLCLEIELMPLYTYPILL